jgi:hypothetical protein
MSEWIVVGVLDGTFVAPDGVEFENVQVIARVFVGQSESPWAALVRDAKVETHINQLLAYRSKGRAEHIVAYELTGKRIELDGVTVKDCG